MNYDANEEQRRPQATLLRDRDGTVYIVHHEHLEEVTDSELEIALELLRTSPHQGYILRGSPLEVIGTVEHEGGFIPFRIRPSP